MAEETLFTLLDLLRKMCRENEDRIREGVDLNRAEYRGLLVLGKDRKITCHEFSQRMELSPSRGSRIIEKLHRKGYIKREELEDNRRSKYIWLTENGILLQNKINSHLEECESRITSNLSESKLRELKGDIAKLAQSMTDT
ncbi:MarR family winged helix-turn-helix transcriptional regulator [Acidobacteriota bacterium]